MLLFIWRVLQDPAVGRLLDRVRPLFMGVSGPSGMSLEALIAAVAAAGMCADGDMEVRNISHLVATVPRNFRVEMGLVRGSKSSKAPTERQLDYALERLISATEQEHLCELGSDPDRPCSDRCPGWLDIDRLLSAVNSLILIAAGVDSSGVMALDSTDAETWSKRRSRGTAADVEPDSYEAHLVNTVNDGSKETKTKPRYHASVTGKHREAVANLHAKWAADPENLPVDPASRRPRQQGPTVPGSNIRSYSDGYPQARTDGRMAHSNDPGATEGWRSGRNANPGEIFLGRDVHAIADGTIDDTGRPVAVVWSWRIQPAGSAKGEVAVELCRGLQADGIPVTSLAEDRAYSTTDAAIHHQPLRNMGIEPVFDLHPNQRGGIVRHQDIPIIDGTPYTNALPRRLRDLPALPRHPQAPKAPGPLANEAAIMRYENQFESYLRRKDKYDEIAVQHDERYAYAFTPNHKGVRSNGAIEYIGPGRRGTVDCPNSKTRPSRGAPIMTCVEGEPCDCRRSITVPADVAPKMRQRNSWGTQKWRAAFNRRVLIESAFKQFKDRYARGTIKARGPKARVLISLLMLGISMRMLRTHKVANGNPAWIKAFKNHKIKTTIKWTRRGPVIANTANPDRDEGT